MCSCVNVISMARPGSHSSYVLCLLYHAALQEAADANDPDSYTPFQFMLQFMLQPLLVASGTTPAGHMAPAIIKMCRTLKRTADTGVSQHNGLTVSTSMQNGMLLLRASLQCSQHFCRAQQIPALESSRSCGPCLWVGQACFGHCHVPSTLIGQSHRTTPPFSLPLPPCRCLPAPPRCTACVTWQSTPSRA